LIRFSSPTPTCRCEPQVPTKNLAKLIKLGDKSVADEARTHGKHKTKSATNMVWVARVQTSYSGILINNPLVSVDCGFPKSLSVSFPFETALIKKDHSHRSTDHNSGIALIFDKYICIVLP
jgi:hypothetical protein